jgi:ribosome recycling factor
MKIKIAILGSTGSIGKSTIKIIKDNPKNFDVVLLTANNNYKELAKQAGAMGEKAKVSIRSARRDAMEEIKKEVKDGYPEDAGKRAETQIEDLMKAFYAKEGALVAAKERDIMTV